MNTVLVSGKIWRNVSARKAELSKNGEKKNSRSSRKKMSILSILFRAKDFCF